MIAVSPDPTTYVDQFTEKVNRFKELISPFSPPELSLFCSPALHYRLRAEFKIWHDGDDSHYAVFNNGRGQRPTFIDNFPIASLAINKLMPVLKSAFESSPILRNRLFQVEFLSTLSGDMLVTMIYHKALTEEWELEARTLGDKLNIKIVGRSKKQKVVLREDYVEEIFSLEKSTLYYRQLEGCFSQPNGHTCQHMLNWALSVTEKPVTGESAFDQDTQKTKGDLLELYCGNGNFTVALAKHFNRVLATEISKPLTATAILNCEKNNIDNVTLVRMSAEDISSALNEEREFRRLENIEIDDFNFSTVFVDPPRAGLDSATEKMVQQFDTILYISCNPTTLVENLKTLTKTHSIERAAFFDQFPYTEHIESGILLRKR